MRKFNLLKVPSILGRTVLCFIILSVNSCNIHQETIAVNSLNNTEIKQRENDCNVSLKIEEKTNERIVLSLHNGTKVPIFLGYKPPNDESGLSSLPFAGFTCQEPGKEEKDYGYHSDASSGFRKLDAGESIRFALPQVPKIKAHCKITVRYFDNIEAINLLERQIKENRNFSDLTETEEEVIDEAQKDITKYLTIRYGK